MKWLKFAIAILLMGAIGWAVWSIRVEREGIEEKRNKLRAELSAITEGNEDIESKIEYYEDEENLLKEAKSQFNYRAPDEELIIIVPEDTDE